MLVSSINFLGRQGRVSKYAQDSQYKLSSAQSELLQTAIDKVRQVKEELPRLAREDCDIRRYKHIGNIEILLNEIARNINMAQGRKNFYHNT